MKKLLAFAVGIALFGAGCQAPSVPSNINGNVGLNSNSNVPAFTPKPASPSAQAKNDANMKTWNPPTVLPAAERENKKAVVETNKGTIVFDIFGDEAPLTASNFIALAKGGYYDGLTFHRVVPGFVIQGGDPTGTGGGGPGYKFKDEPVKRKYDPGIVAMANAGPDTNGSQFFIMEPDSDSGMLQPLYTIFGKVTDGLDVVGKIQVGDVMNKVTIEDTK
jgi:cyclophilin family peptidyl-prolyl cis-trans isomerase